MRSKVITSLLPDYDKLSGKRVFFLLSFITFFIRFPFFFRDYVDRDESTFILVAQSLVEGHLPYTELWDLKPPIIYFIFALIIYLFGKSFIALRLVGVFAVVVTAFFSYRIGSHLGSKKIGFWAAVACIMLLSMFGSLQGVMSEHICMLFFTPAVYLLIEKRNAATIFFAGLLIGLALMTKLNIAYAALLLGLFIVYEAVTTIHSYKNLGSPLLFCMGVGLAILLTILPYSLEGKTAIWWDSVVLAPLQYSSSRRYSLLQLSPIFIFVGVFLFYSWKKKLFDFKKRSIQILIIAILGVLISYLQSGRVNGHYLIQLHPMLTVLVALAISRVDNLRKLTLRPVWWFFLLLLPVEAYLEYYAVVKNKIERGTFFNGEGFTVPQYLSENSLENGKVFFLEYHIGYWLLNKKPPTRAATHPSNICRDEMYAYFDNPRKTSLQELRFIMEELRPETVVTRKNRWVFDRDEIEENDYIDHYLNSHYKILAIVDNAVIHQRSE